MTEAANLPKSMAFPLKERLDAIENSRRRLERAAEQATQATAHGRLVELQAVKRTLAAIFEREPVPTPGAKLSIVMDKDRVIAEIEQAGAVRWNEVRT